MGDDEWVIDVASSIPSRPVDPRHEDAYWRWVLNPQKGRGAMEKISQETGVPVKLLKSWKYRQGWEERWRSDVLSAKVKLVREAEATLLINLQASMARLGDIAINGRDRDAVSAVKVLAAILGLDQSKATINVLSIDPQLIEQAREVSKGEMKRALATISQQNQDENRR